MSLTGIIDALRADPAFTSMVGRAHAGTAAELDVVGPAPARPFVIAAIAQAASVPLLVVTSTYREAEQLTDAVGSIIGDDTVCYYPAWETLPHERLSPRIDIVGRRLEVLHRLSGKSGQPVPKVVIAPIRSLLQPQVKGLGDLEPVHISVGAEYPISDLIEDLIGLGYSRVDLVERRGDLAVRGGIVDLFIPTMDRPVRIDFFGDEIDEITYFSVADQRSTEVSVEAVTAVPCRELLLTDAVRARARTLIPSHPELAEMLTKIAEGHKVEGMESLIPALVDEMELYVDVFPADTTVLVSDPELVRTRAIDLVKTSDDFLNSGWIGAAAGGDAPIDLGEAAYRTLVEVRDHAIDRGMNWWSSTSFGNLDHDDAETLDLDVSAVIHLQMTANPSWQGDTEQVMGRIRQLIKEGWRVVLSVDGRGIANRMADVVRDHDMGATLVDDLSGEPEAGTVTIVCSGLRLGFSCPAAKLVVVTTSDISGQLIEKTRDKLPTRRRKHVSPMELKAGDYVVHERHGVGRFVEICQRTVGGATRDYLVIEFAPSRRGQPGDRLFVPMAQLDSVTRYVGGEAPSLDRMGGADWRARKAKARKAVRQIAGELIKLYAARQATKGFAFSPDTVWQREMEDAFVYSETADQLCAIDEVKRDMEQVVPMDRLICGDVGYGKTEIAVRAAFKAVQDSKQVAVLVPTTLLVKQHYQTFADRYVGFPVRVAMLSRFQSEAEAKKVIEGLENGQIDVVVGTHRLLSKSVVFKDLGLVIIDEEQRFGVEHKEALKKLRVNVDVLTMSATPIPRTLEMAITGIREMSVIATPPEERHPVLTFAGPWDEGQVVAAIRRELAREGQVFYLHNKVRSIEKVASRLRELVPEARIVTAHGQMGEKKLENVMEAFWQREADVLVCTTIVEAGLDISTANTLIVESSETLGLSQLHQLRGRVGRGRERGYAYLFYRGEKALTETAHQRIETMAAQTDLGAGMSIAMKDLEIRGAGNMLGGEQSGHIADVGFDLYIQMVGQAVADYRGEGRPEDVEVRIELPIDANLPTDYVESERLRLEMYKRLAEAKTEADLEEIAAELTDRYGPIPLPAAKLLNVARFRQLAMAAGITEAVTQGPNLKFAPVVDLPDSRRMRMMRLYPGAKFVSQAKHVLIPLPKPRQIGGRLTDDEVFDFAMNALKTVFTPIVAAAPNQDGSTGQTS